MKLCHFTHAMTMKGGLAIQDAVPAQCFCFSVPSPILHPSTRQEARGVAGEALWIHKHLVCYLVKLVLSSLQGAVLCSTSVPHSVLALPNASQTFPQGELAKSYVHMFFSHYNTVILKKDYWSNQEWWAQSLWRLQPYLTGLCALGLLHFYDSENTIFYSYVVSFSLFCIFLTVSYWLPHFSRIY